MTWLLLFGLTALVIALPMLPALVEWRRPTDIVPLHIDAQDALDPTFVARAFAGRMTVALAAAQKRLSDKAIARIPVQGVWLLDPDEQRSGTSHRIWHADGHATMPDGLRCLGEVHVRGRLTTARDSVCAALWSGQTLELRDGTAVMHWAHGASVEVGPDCRLQGRVSADRSIALRGSSSFTLLHAPVIAFGPASPRPSVLPRAERSDAPLPVGVRWDAAARRGTCDTACVLDDGRVWDGALVCAGDLSLGAQCVVDGNLKAGGAIVVGEDCHLAGALVAEGGIVLGAGCIVQGPVVSETVIVLGPGCRIGAPDRPATVAAPRIEVGAGVVVHGTLWAGQSGQLTFDPVAALQADVVEDVVAPPERLAA